MKRQLSSFYLILFTVFSVCHVNNQSYGKWYENPQIIYPLITVSLIILIPIRTWVQNRREENKKKEIELMAEKLNAANRLHLVSPRPVIAN
jgi:hypothetical protein